MKWILIVYLILPSPGKSLFIVPQVQFQSQTECVIAKIDLELYLKTVGDYAITCASVKPEREA